MTNMYTIKMGPTNCYLLKSKDGFLLIDTSMPEYYQLFLKELRSVKIDLSEIKYLLLTHSHDDHAGFAAEEQYRTVNMEKITQKINESSIYISIFGRIKSLWTEAEYRAAKARDIPLLIFYYKPSRIIERRGRRSDVMAFLEKEVKPLININGYDERYSSEAQLIVDILNKVAMQTAEMVIESANVKKIIHKATIIPNI